MTRADEQRRAIERDNQARVADERIQQTDRAQREQEQQARLVREEQARQLAERQRQQRAQRPPPPLFNRDRERQNPLLTTLDREL